MTQTPYPYIDREVSQLRFYQRVTEQAARDDRPLSDRCRFLGLSARTLEDYFGTRVPQLLKKDSISSLWEGTLRPLAEGLLQRQCGAYRHMLRPLLCQQGVSVIDTTLPIPPLASIETLYEQRIRPALSPLAVDSRHPFPTLRQETLYFAIEYAQKEKIRHILLPLPAGLPRLMSVSGENGRTLFLLEALIQPHLADILPPQTPFTFTLFRVVFDRKESLHYQADKSAKEPVSLHTPLPRAITRLDLLSNTPPGLRRFLEDATGVSPSCVFLLSPPLDLTFCETIGALRATGQKPSIAGLSPSHTAEKEPDSTLFSDLRAGDRLLHHPYDAFDQVTAFLQAAAKDNDVLSIRQTLYRAQADSAVVHALTNAAQRGKEVIVVIEPKARDDERKNLTLAKALRDAGCHVVYGLKGYKVHGKALLVLRREKDGLKLYTHLSTGNYHAVTAKQYTDLGLLTAREAIGREAARVFQMLTGGWLSDTESRLVTAPGALRRFLSEQISREMDNARSGRPAGIFLKVNALSDRALIRQLYEASAAGVAIRLMVRGICCLVPGIPGISDHIRVFSLVGQLLEHSRIFRFENGGNPCLYLGSADLMPRNLDKRIEFLFPIEDTAAKNRLERIISLFWKDTFNTYELLSDGHYRRRINTNVPFDCQAAFWREAAGETADGTPVPVRFDRFRELPQI